MSFQMSMSDYHDAHKRRHSTYPIQVSITLCGDSNELPFKRKICLYLHQPESEVRVNNISIIV